MKTETELDRVCIPEMDEILGVPFKVLDKGYVRVIDYMGGDEAIVQAARVSYGKGTKKVHEDCGLIRYLMRHRHTTPFEMCEIKLHVKVPMDCWRQWIRHRTANVNEYSTRYSEAIDDCQQTHPSKWRLQSGRNKQGSGEFITEWPENVDDVDMDKELCNSPGEHLSSIEKAIQDSAREIYDDRLKYGVAREQARKDLPLSNYTEAYWKIDLHNLLHFLSLRMDAHAQLEIRSYANVIGEEITSRWCPHVWEAFKDYRLEAMYLTRLDRAIVQAIYEKDNQKIIGLADDFGWLSENKKGELRRNRERDECDEKLKSLGLNIEWDNLYE